MAGLGALAGGGDALMEILAQKLREEQVRNQARQFAQRLALDREQEAGVNRRFESGQTFTAGENQKGRDFASGQSALSRDFTAGENQKGREFSSGEAQKGRDFSAGQGALQRDFAAGESQKGRDFTSGENAKSRGLTASEGAKNRNNALTIAGVRVAGSLPQTSAQEQREQNEVEDSLALIKQIREDKALPNATGPIQGRGAGALWGMGDYERVKALHNNLVNKMQLAQAGKLKGQGQISNMEREMLKNAATALDRKLADPDYLNELAKVEQQFQRMLTGPRAAPGAAPTGGGKGDPLGIR